MSLETSIHLRNHNPNLCHKHTYRLQKFPSTFFIYYYYSMITICNIRSALFAKFKAYNTVLLVIGYKLLNRSQGPVHPV